MAMINDELLARFFSNQCTPDEIREVASYLQEHPGVLEKYLSEEEFMQLPLTGDIPETVSGQWLKHIHRQTGVVNNRIKWIKRLAVACVMTGALIGASWLLVNHDHKEMAATEKPLAAIPQAEREQKGNTTGKPMAIVLPDGSVVQLMPEASVIYDKQFKENRNIYLTGEADFTVVPDKSYAFTVHSGEVFTTALGTFFHVKALAGEDIITVRLNSGKVMVQAGVNKIKTMEDVVLTPGKELRYNRKTGKATVFNYHTAGPDVLVKAGNNSGRANAKPDWYKFNNQPMTQVLDQLSNYYGIAIYYRPSDITEIYFDGKFEKTDSLDKILTDLTRPNNLALIRNDSGFIIRKK